MKIRNLKKKLKIGVDKMNEERFVIISTDEFESRIYDNVDNDFLNLEQILDLLNDYEMLCSTLWSDFNE